MNYVDMRNKMKFRYTHDDLMMVAWMTMFYEFSNEATEHIRLRNLDDPRINCDGLWDEDDYDAFIDVVDDFHANVMDRSYEGGRFMFTDDCINALVAAGL